MGRFRGLAGIRTNQGGLYFLPGDYTVDINEVKFMESRKRKEVFIIGGTVVESTNAERAPGCKPSQVITIREDIFATVMGNIKNFAGATLGIDDPDAFVAPSAQGLEGEALTEAMDKFWDDFIELLVADDNYAKGMRLRLNCVNIQTKEKKDFTKHVWGARLSVPEVWPEVEAVALGAQAAA